VLEQFAAVAGPLDRLVVANTGSLAGALAQQVQRLGLTESVSFVGRLDAATQADCYARARWFLSLPDSDSVAVSVLEAMAHGCVPLLSDLPANHELVRDGENGLIVPAHGLLSAADLAAVLPRAGQMASQNRQWVQQHALFAPCVERFLQRLRSLA